MNEYKKEDVKKRKSWQACAVTSFLLFLLSLSCVYAVPPLPTEFYGSVKFYNIPGQVGAVVRVLDSTDQLCGRFSVSRLGYYGVLSCNGDWTDTGTDEGAMAGESVLFTYNGVPAGTIGDASFTAGTFKRVDLIIPPLVCGDGFCDSLETQYECPIDCGEPPTNETNTTPLPPPPGGAEGGGGGGGGSGGAPPAGAAAQGGCSENWVCSGWSTCEPPGVQSRNCTDISLCRMTDKKPLVEQECVYVPTCVDGLMDGLETGIDCGGPCLPCAHCFDGVQDFGEEEMDCGGPCPSCPSCYDGKKNQNETGVDCGGLCGPCKKFFETPRMVCVRMIEPFNPYFIVFIVFLVLVIISRVVFSELGIKKVRADQKLSEVKKAAFVLGTRRRMYLFIITIVGIALILFLYYYFIGICYEINRSYIWLLLLVLFLFPIIVHYIMKHYEYDEKRRIQELRILHDTHYRQIMELIRIQNEHLLDLENSIAATIMRLQKSEDFAVHLKEFPELRMIYKEVLVLFDKYKKTKTPYTDERLLCETIVALTEKEGFKSLAEKEPEVKIILDKLTILYKTYVEKQTLYDELDKTEHPDEDAGAEISVAASPPEKTKQEKEEGRWEGKG